MSEEFQQQNVARKKCMCNQTLFVPSLFLHYSNLNRIPEVIAYMCTQHLHAHSQHSLVLPSGNMEMGKTAAWNEHVGHATISFLTAVKAVCRCTPRGVVGVRICIIVSITSRRVTFICQMLVIAEKKKIDRHLEGGMVISSGSCDILRREISRKILTALLSAPLYIMKEGKK